jgi:hypothetical protein
MGLVMSACECIDVPPRRSICYSDCLTPELEVYLV